MARIFITGSSDGLGQEAARRLVGLRHNVDLQWRQRRRNGSQAYANSKLFDLVLAFAVARLWPHVLSNAVDPGIAPTKMAGASAPGDLELGAATQVWLAVSEEPGANVTGRCFYQKRTRPARATASDVTVQDAFLAACEQLTGVRLASSVTK